MCGIAGTIDFTRDVRELSDLPGRMAQALTRRGPDAEGVYQDCLLYTSWHRWRHR